LHTDRPINLGGAGAIPFSAIDQYASRYGVVVLDEFDRFRDLLRAMDGEYLKWVSERKGDQGRG
jgi:hypothetical protein